jgi:hypothetical protein
MAVENILSEINAVKLRYGPDTNDLGLVMLLNARQLGTPRLLFEEA